MGAILVLNAGSSSVKFQAFTREGGALSATIKGSITGIGAAAAFQATGPAGAEARTWDGGPPSRAALSAFLIGWLEERLDGVRVEAVGHRVVHGGTRFAEPVVVDAAVLAELRGLCSLAPLHQPHNLAFIDAFAEADPALPQVACFDTAFHRTVADTEALFGLPRALADKGIRRYGFHGLSYEYVARALAERSPRARRGRVVIAHLGSGASLCAVDAGRSVASTMGFTALDGLVMGTRCGSLDPGAVLHLIEHEGMTPAEVTKLLYNQSGLLGLSGVSNDMRALLASEAPAARQAVDVFVHRVVRETGALAAVLGGLDAIVFTAGIGERSAAIREAVCRKLRWLGVALDEAANAAGAERISAVGSAIEAWRIDTDEERMIAESTARLLGGAA